MVAVGGADCLGVGLKSLGRGYAFGGMSMLLGRGYMLWDRAMLLGVGLCSLGAALCMEIAPHPAPA